jgi:hypothetical protein
VVVTQLLQFLLDLGGQNLQGLLDGLDFVDEPSVLRVEGLQRALGLKVGKGWERWEILEIVSGERELSLFWAGEGNHSR